MSGQGLQVVGGFQDVSEIGEYPLGPDERLDSHSFLAWEFRRWMSSDMRWNGTHECKSMFFECVNLSYSETPVGTLPNDLGRISRMIQPNVEKGTFEQLCKLKFGPLHGWQLCRVDDQIRLMHPVVTRIVLSAFASRAKASAANEAASYKRKLDRLTEEIAQVHPAFAGDPRKVRFICKSIDDRISARGGSRRTGQDLHAAIQDCIRADREGKFPQRSDH